MGTEERTAQEIKTQMTEPLPIGFDANNPSPSPGTAQRSLLSWFEKKDVKAQGLKTPKQKKRETQEDDRKKKKGYKKQEETANGI